MSGKDIGDAILELHGQVATLRETCRDMHAEIATLTAKLRAACRHDVEVSALVDDWTLGPEARSMAGLQGFAMRCENCGEKRKPTHAEAVAIVKAQRWCYSIIGYAYPPQQESDAADAEREHDEKRASKPEAQP